MTRISNPLYNNNITPTPSHNTNTNWTAKLHILHLHTFTHCITYNTLEQCKSASLSSCNDIGVLAGRGNIKCTCTYMQDQRDKTDHASTKCQCVNLRSPLNVNNDYCSVNHQAKHIITNHLIILTWSLLHNKFNHDQNLVLLMPNDMVWQDILDSPEH